MQLKSLNTNGKRNHCQSVFFMFKPKYVEDLTVQLYNKKQSKVANGKTCRTVDRRHTQHTTNNKQYSKNTDTMIPPGHQLPATSNY